MDEYFTKKCVVLTDQTTKENVMKNDIDVFLIQSAIKNDIGLIMGLISSYGGDNLPLASPLYHAVVRNYHELTALLIPYCNVSFNDSDLLDTAMQTKAYDCAKLLIPHSNPKDRRSSALQWASIHQNQEMFDLLYPLSDPQAALEALNYMRPDNKQMLEQRLKIEQEHTAISQALPQSFQSKPKSKI